MEDLRFRHNAQPDKWKVPQCLDWAFTLALTMYRPSRSKSEDMQGIRLILHIRYDYTAGVGCVKGRIEVESAAFGTECGYRRWSGCRRIESFCGRSEHVIQAQSMRGIARCGLVVCGGLQRATMRHSGLLFLSSDIIASAAGWCKYAFTGFSAASCARRLGRCINIALMSDVQMGDSPSRISLSDCGNGD
jgi:hypothetical protein